MSYYIHPDDGLPVYSRGRYEIHVKIVDYITIEANPNNDDEIAEMVQDWISDHVDEIKFEIEEITEVFE